jgi:hypothetical protein
MGRRTGRAGPGGLPWPAGQPIRSAVALACPPVRTAMVDRRVHHLAFGVVYGVSERPF